MRGCISIICLVDPARSHAHTAAVLILLPSPREAQSGMHVHFDLCSLLRSGWYHLPRGDHASLHHSTALSAPMTFDVVDLHTYPHIRSLHYLIHVHVHVVLEQGFIKWVGDFYAYKAGAPLPDKLIPSLNPPALYSVHNAVFCVCVYVNTVYFVQSCIHCLLFRTDGACIWLFFQIVCGFCCSRARKCRVIMLYVVLPYYTLTANAYRHEYVYCMSE